MARQSAEWPAAFATAAELTRREYAVAFFLGNQPRHDALVLGTASGNQFAIQVKGFAQGPPKRKGKGTAIIPGKLAGGDPGDFFVLVYVPSPPKPFEFFIATRQELQGIKNPDGPPVGTFTSDYFYYPQIAPFRDAWAKLPRS